jgi:hypothetical protein
MRKANKQSRASNKTTSKAPQLDPDETPLSPSADAYKLLCQLAAFILRLQPWANMAETDVFGLRDPDTGKLGFVSVMGELGQYQRSLSIAELKVYTPCETSRNYSSSILKVKRPTIC